MWREGGRGQDEQLCIFSLIIRDADEKGRWKVGKCHPLTFMFSGELAGTVSGRFLIILGEGCLWGSPALTPRMGKAPARGASGSH